MRASNSMFDLVWYYCTVETQNRVHVFAVWVRTQSVRRKETGKDVQEPLSLNHTPTSCWSVSIVVYSKLSSTSTERVRNNNCTVQHQHIQTGLKFAAAHMDKPNSFLRIFIVSGDKNCHNNRRFMWRSQIFKSKHTTKCQGQLCWLNNLDPVHFKRHWCISQGEWNNEGLKPPNCFSSHQLHTLLTDMMMYGLGGQVKTSTRLDFIVKMYYLHFKGSFVTENKPIYLNFTDSTLVRGQTSSLRCVWLILMDERTVVKV